MSKAKIPEPWEQQPEESPEAWLAFRAYRDMPPNERQIRRAGTAPATTLSRWYRDHNWRQRVLAFDAVFDRIRVEERETVFRKSARDMEIDHIVALADLRDLFTREVSKLNEASRNSPEMPGLIKPGELIKMAEVVIKLERLARGQTTENVGTTDLDLSGLTLDEVCALQALMTKAGMKVDSD